MNKGELIVVRNTLDWCKAMVEALQEDTNPGDYRSKILQDIRESLGTINRELDNPLGV